MRNNDSKLNLAVVPQSFLDKMEIDINDLKELLRSKNEKEINMTYIESTKIPELLGISRKTWQSYRDKRMIPFSQIGNKIYVKREDLESFMNNHYITAKR